MVLWHGDTDQPDGAATTWLTATPPPATVTMADNHEPEDGAGTLGTRSPRAGTDTAAFSTDPVSVSSRTVAATARPVVLVRSRKPGAPPAEVVCPVQYQADDSALAGLTSEAGTTSGLTGAGVPRAPAATPTPATTTTTSTSILQRCSRLLWAGVMLARAGGAAARPGRPRSATSRTTQASTSSETASGTSGNCERCSVAVPDVTWNWAAQPKAGRRTAVRPFTDTLNFPAGA